MTCVRCHHEFCWLWCAIVFNRHISIILTNCFLLQSWQLVDAQSRLLQRASLRFDSSTLILERLRFVNDIRFCSARNRLLATRQAIDGACSSTLRRRLIVRLLRAQRSFGLATSISHRCARRCDSGARRQKSIVGTFAFEPFFPSSATRWRCRRRPTLRTHCAALRRLARGSQTHTTLVGRFVL